MRAHLRYLRYVVRHKWFVFLAGVQIAYVNGYAGLRGVRFLWRLLVHDASKFRPSEWRPYVAQFYGPSPDEELAHETTVAMDFEPALPVEVARERARRVVTERQRDRRAAFDRAWLAHQHRNPHHWQHWVLREDSGKTLVLLPPAEITDEMLADWIGAGSKVLTPGLTLRDAIAETIAWYAANHQRIMLRDLPRTRVERTLLALAARFGILAEAQAIQSAKAARQSLVIPGRAPLEA